MTWIFIEPTDVWLFRDGRPFSAGEGHMARSLFPPTPQTLQGAIRSLILGHSEVLWRDFRRQRTSKAKELGRMIGWPAYRKGEVEVRADLGRFGMAGPFLARLEEECVVRCTPLPADVVREKKRGGRYFALRPARGLPFKADWPKPTLFPLWPEQEEDIEVPEEPEWLAETVLDNYLQGKAFSGMKAGELFGSEPRFGIALDYSKRRPVRRMLYQAEFIRLNKNVGLLIRLSDEVRLPAPKGVMSLGGEARAARYRVMPDEEIKALEVDAGLKQPAVRLKLVLLTPAFFDGGWRPQDGVWSRWFGGQSVRLVSIALNRPTRIGGWDIAARNGRGWHKPMRAYVPAGSVYFFEADQPIVPPTRPVTQTPEGELPLERLGFGQVAIGTWEWLDF